MKIIKLAWSVLLPILLAAHAVRAQSPAAARAAPKAKIFLHTGWKFREAGKGEWRAATVPGCVHTDLLANGLIEDPFYRDNEPKLQWIGKTDWEYQTVFDAPASLLRREHVELVFEGLDTYATVTLNGAPLLEADNMFRTWRVDCKRLLRPGANTLHVTFRSPINEVLPLMAKLGYQLPAQNDQGEKTSPYTRKAPYQYGWDWGPRFVTSGIWRPVSLEAWDAARVSNLRVVQNQLGETSAQLTAEVEVVSSGERDALVVVENLTDRAAPARLPVKLTAGTNKVTVN